MFFTETIILALLLFALITIVLVPFGLVLCRLVVPKLKPGIAFLVSFALSSLFYSAILALMLGLGLSSQSIFIGLWLLVALSLFALLFLLHRKSIHLEKVYPVFCIFLLYYLFAIISSVFPQGDYLDLSPRSMMLFSRLTMDNIIPYNSARYLLEGISPQAIEVVPTWSFFDRGPLAALLTALLFSLLKINETSHWLAVSPGLYFVYHCLMVYLNALVIIPVWCGAHLWFRGHSPKYALALLFSSYFFLINVIFTWPKFLMAYFVLTALLIYFLPNPNRRSSFLVGLLLGGALLCHEIAFFYIIAFALLCAIKLLSSKEWMRFPHYLLVLAGGTTAYLPWFIYKTVANTAPGGSRILLLNMFCIKDQDLSGVSFYSTLKSYLQNHSLLELITIRLNNLLYPFDFSAVWSSQGQSWERPYEMVAYLSNLVFYQFVYAIGLPTLLLLLLKTPLLLSHKNFRIIAQLSFICIVALCIVSVLFGCPLSTWNHVWVYPTFGIVAVFTAGITNHRSLFIKCTFCFSVATNLLFQAICFWFSRGNSLILHASKTYILIWFFSLILVFLPLLFIKAPKEDI